MKQCLYIIVFFAAMAISSFGSTVRADIIGDSYQAELTNSKV